MVVVVVVEFIFCVPSLLILCHIAAIMAMTSKAKSKMAKPLKSVFPLSVIAPLHDLKFSLYNYTHSDSDRRLLCAAEILDLSVMS